MNSVSALYSSLCLNKNLSTQKVLKLMLQIMNIKLNHRSQGITSVEIEQFIQNLANTNYINMTLKEVKSYFETNYNNDNNNDNKNDNDNDNKKEKYDFITENLNSNKQYDCNFEQLNSFELDDLLTISASSSKQNITIFVYKNLETHLVTCLKAVIELN